MPEEEDYGYHVDADADAAIYVTDDDDGDDDDGDDGDDGDDDDDDDVDDEVMTIMVKAMFL